MRLISAILLVLLTVLLAGVGDTRASGRVDRPWERWWWNEREAFHPPRTPLPEADRTQVVEAIAEFLESEARLGQDVKSTSLLLLARATTDAKHVRILEREGFVGQGSRQNVRALDIVQESALLGLGLLCRSDPDRQFPAGQLDNVREGLFEALENHHRHARARAIAALALGLLGDQPSGPVGHPDVGRALTTARIFRHLDFHVPPPTNLPAPFHIGVAMLVAIALQPPSSVNEAQRDLLRHLTWGEGFGGRAAPDLVAAWATVALARHAKVGDLDQFAGLLARKGRVAAVRRRAAAMALGRLASDLPEEQRPPFQAALEHGIEHEEDAGVRHLARISLARLGTVLPETRKTFERGEPIARASAAVAIALSRRERDERGWDALAARLLDRDLAWDARAAFLLAAGLAREIACRDSILTILVESRRNGSLGWQAADAIGLLGDVSEEETQVLLAVLDEPKLGTASPVARVLGPAATDVLVARLREGQTASARMTAARALGETGDARAIAPLLAVVRDTERTDLERAIACAALGVLVDPEPRPSLRLLKQGFDAGAGTPALYEVWSIQ